MFYWHDLRDASKDLESALFALHANKDATRERELRQAVASAESWFDSLQIRAEAHDENRAAQVGSEPTHEDIMMILQDNLEGGLGGDSW